MLNTMLNTLHGFHKKKKLALSQGLPASGVKVPEHELTRLLTTHK